MALGREIPRRGLASLSQGCQDKLGVCAAEAEAAAGVVILTLARRILTYLIPCRLLTSHVLPTKRLLESYPRLRQLFLPLAQCIRRGDLRGFDVALQEREDELVKRRIYLTLERGRDIALRNLLRKVFIAGGFDEPKEPNTAPVRRTRVPVSEFRAAICMGSGGELVDPDEVECLLANMIYKVGSMARGRGESLTGLVLRRIS